MNYLEKKGVTRYQFYKDTGLSNGFLDKEGNIGSDKCELICNKYPDLDLNWLITGKGEMIKDEPIQQNELKEEQKPYITYRRKLKLETKEVYFPVYNVNTRLREDPHLAVYEDDPGMLSPITFLPQAAFPGCDHGEKAFGNSMYPRVINQGMVLGKVLDKSKLVYNELYGIHLKGGSPPVVKYVQRSSEPGCIKLVSERESLGHQDIPIDDITFMFRVLFIINPA